MKRKIGIYFVIIGAAIVLLHSLYKSIFYDPGATIFLGHKLEFPKHELAWLNMLHIHIWFACIAVIAGAWNLIMGKTEKGKKIHRIIGYLYVIGVFVVDLTSGYLAPSATGGKAASIAFNTLNAYWIVVTVIAVIKARRQQLLAHRRFMLRSYVFCFTNLSIQLVTNVLESMMGLSFQQSYIIAVNVSVVGLFLLGEVLVRFCYPSSKHNS